MTFSYLSIVSTLGGPSDFPGNLGDHDYTHCVLFTASEICDNNSMYFTKMLRRLNEIVVATKLFLTKKFSNFT